MTCHDPWNIPETAVGCCRLSIPAGSSFQKKVGHAFVAHLQRSMKWCSKVPNKATSQTSLQPWHAENLAISIAMHCFIFMCSLVFCAALRCSPFLSRFLASIFVPLWTLLAFLPSSFLTSILQFYSSDTWNRKTQTSCKSWMCTHIWFCVCSSVWVFARSISKNNCQTPVFFAVL